LAGLIGPEYSAAMRMRACQGQKDTEAIQRLASRCWPRGHHPGGIGWSGATEQLPAKVTLAVDGDGGCAGWAGVHGGSITLQADSVGPAGQDAAEGLLTWAVAVVEPGELTVEVFDGDETVRTAVTEAGFVPSPAAAPVGGMFRDLDPGLDRPAERASLPDGYRLRSVRADEQDARVDAHRRAWRPATLPWPGDPPPSVTQETTSRFNAALYSQVQATWLYDPAFDLVVEAPDGSLAACCIAWSDPATGCAEIEPVGVVPEHRRRGLASALCWQVIEQVRAADGRQVYINIGPNPAYPAPAQTYLAVGFDFVVRGQLHHRPR
jgi:GNAT superfamily N-acetyltransferase